MQNHQATRTILIQKPDDKVETIKQVAQISRRVKTDLVTNRSQFGTWSQAAWSSFQVPKVAGYTASVLSIPETQITAESRDITVNVTYTKNQASKSKLIWLTIQFNHNGQVINSFKLSGYQGDVESLTRLIPVGYKLLNSSDDSVYFSHPGTISIPIVDKTRLVQDSKQVTRTILLEDENNNILKRIKENAKLHRSGSFDEVTQQITWQPWTQTTFGWGGLVFPTKIGDEQIVGPRSVNAVNVDGKTDSQAVIVRYKKMVKQVTKPATSQVVNSTSGSVIGSMPSSLTGVTSSQTSSAVGSSSAVSNISESSVSNNSETTSSIDSNMTTSLSASSQVSGSSQVTSSVTVPNVSLANNSKVENNSESTDSVNSGVVTSLPASSQLSESSQVTSSVTIPNVSSTNSSKVVNNSESTDSVNSSTVTSLPTSSRVSESSQITSSVTSSNVSLINGSKVENNSQTTNSVINSTDSQVFGPTVSEHLKSNNVSDSTGYVKNSVDISLVNYSQTADSIAGVSLNSSHDTNLVASSSNVNNSDSSVLVTSSASLVYLNSTSSSVQVQAVPTNSSSGSTSYQFVQTSAIKSDSSLQVESNHGGLFLSSNSQSSQSNAQSELPQTGNSDKSIAIGASLLAAVMMTFGLDYKKVLDRDN